jgi:hypothetical protein
MIFSIFNLLKFSTTTDKIASLSDRQRLSATAALLLSLLLLQWVLVVVV